MAREYQLNLSDAQMKQIKKERLDALKRMVPQAQPPDYQGPVYEIATGKKIEETEIPEWAAKEIRETWRAMKSCDGQLEAYRICERMVDRLGYGRTDDNPPLI